MSDLKTNIQNIKENTTSHNISNETHFKISNNIPTYTFENKKIKTPFNSPIIIPKIHVLSDIEELSLRSNMVGSQK